MATSEIYTDCHTLSLHDALPISALVLAYNGPLATAFCFWAVVSVTRALPAITTSLSLLAVPVTGVAASALFLAEPLPPTLLTGLVLILGGTVLVNLENGKASCRERGCQYV